MVTIRKNPLVTKEIYHIFNKSIAEYKIFNNEIEFLRIIETIWYYQKEKRKLRFSQWKKSEKKDFFENEISDENNLVDIIAYCIMPTHIHLILKQLKDKGISIFMSRISNSYARYFNLAHKRKGPLWVKEFGNVLVTTDEQLLHLTMYVHLNPTSAFLVDRPEDWLYSSYKEFLGEIKQGKKICNLKNYLDINPISYKNFVEDRVSYQRELGKIKNLILE